MRVWNILIVAWLGLGSQAELHVLFGGDGTHIRSAYVWLGVTNAVRKPIAYVWTILDTRLHASWRGGGTQSAFACATVTGRK